MRTRGTASPADEIQERLVALLLLRPEKVWHRSELARSLDVSAATLQRALDALEADGLLTGRPDGNRVSYVLDETHPRLPELRARDVRTIGLVDILRDTLAPHAQKIHMAFLCGRLADEDHESSERLDLMVVGSLGAAELKGPLGEIRQKLGHEVHPTVYSLGDFDDRRQSRHAFLTALLRRPRVMLVGTERDMQ